MKVTVFGVGYVGLVQAAVLADTGHQVCCVDVDEHKIARLREGHIPIFEPGLEPMVIRCMQAGALSFTTQADQGVAHGEVIFIAVGTPPDEDGSADLKYVLSVATTIAEHMSVPRIIVNKSTVPVGTADKVKQCISEVLTRRGVELAFEVASNPEFLKEGSAVADCQRPDRIIIGTQSAWVEERLRALYQPFNRNHEKILVMDVRSAELTKYAANCMLATKISFMNEMANLAERLGADIESVRKGIGSDPRIGYHFIYPGCGYGGSCFPKDVQALERSARRVGYEPQILQAVEAVNQRQKLRLIELINHHFGNDLKGRHFALWGLSFKPNTDDMREAPSRVVMEALWAAGATVAAYDPEAMEEAGRLYGQQGALCLVSSRQAALKDADALIIVTEWREFKVLDAAELRQQMREPVVFDGRNLFEPDVLEREGVTYYGIGRGLSVRDFS